MIDAEELDADEKVSDAKVKDLLVRCRKCLMTKSGLDHAELGLKHGVDFYGEFERSYMCKCLQFVSGIVKCLSASSVEELELKLGVIGY